MRGKKKSKFHITGFFAIVFILAAGFFITSIVVNTQNASSYYKQGLEYYNEGDFQNAYYNFSKILPTSPIFLNGLYRQAKSADAIDDKKTALKKYKIFESLIKDKNITPFVLWRIANLQYDSEDFKAAKRNFLKLKKKYDDTEYGIAANYMLARLEDDKSKKKDYLIEYMKHSPDGRYAKRVLTYLLDNQDIPMNLVDKLIFGKSLTANGYYREAAQVLRAVPINVAWVYLVKSLDKLNYSSSIIEVGKRAFLFDNSKFDETELAEAIAIYIKHDRKNPFLSSKEIYETAKDKKTKGIALYQNSLYTKGQEGMKTKADFYQNYSNSKFASNVLFNLFMENLKNGRDNAALKYGKMYLGRFDDQENTPCVLYFVACLKKRLSDKTYKLNLNRLLAEYPNSYYAYRGYVTFVDENFANKDSFDITKRAKIDFPNVEDKKAADFFENFAVENDYKAFNDFRIKDQIISSWIEYRKGNRAQSSIIARDYINNRKKLPKRTDSVWKLAYPIYYDKEITKYSNERNLDPYLILSLVKEESHFDPNIRSGVGATGLMQVMPSTASMIAGRYYSPAQLKDEDLNIRLGTLYFSHLMDIFSDDEPLCVMSYNSGPNAVKKWINSYSSMGFDIMIENIPYKETRNYIKKVYTSYWNYLLTYEGVKI